MHEGGARLSGWMGQVQGDSSISIKATPRGANRPGGTGDGAALLSGSAVIPTTQPRNPSGPWSLCLQAGVILSSRGPPRAH